MIRHLKAEIPALLAFRGPDAVRFLNGQLTQDVRNLGADARLSCITDAKGRLQFTVSVFQGDDESDIRVAGPSGRAVEIIARLERYLIADEVEIEDLTGRWVRVHAEGPLEGAAFARTAAGPFGEGVDHWYPCGSEPDDDPISDDEAETLRVSAGIPAWGRELEEGMLPPEAGLDRHAIGYDKGCYIGQEVLSRIKSVGRVNRRLARFSTDATRPAPLMDEEGEVGHLTSVSPGASEDGSRAALGYLRKRSFDREHFNTPDGSGVAFIGWA